VQQTFSFSPPSDTENETDTDDDKDMGECDNSTNDSVPASNANCVLQWELNAFMNPLKLLSQMSGFPNLYVLYSIFFCLAVSSASAERALSKLKIIKKNRLRSSLADDYLSALMLVASEKDLMQLLTDDDIIFRVASSCPKLRGQLIY
jgi:hypothetical protein